MKPELAWLVVGFVLAIAAVVLFGRGKPTSPSFESGPFPSSWQCTERPLQQGSGTVRVCEPPKKEKNK